MGEEMGGQLQKTLRSLCFKTQWRYAVFWKLKHRARMMLTCEDAYYTNHRPSDPSENSAANMCFNNTHGNLHDEHYMGDPLGLAVAKMSYLVYSLGEGIIGQVACTGKHRWIFADKPASNSWSSSEYCDGWQAQFSAGIKTIAVVPVVPHGVVQLGSLNTVIEDLNLVTHIKDVFGLLQNSSEEFLPDPIHYTMRNILNPSDILTKSSRLEESNDCLYRLHPVESKRSNIQHLLLPSRGNYDNLSCDVLALPGSHQRKAVQVDREHVMVKSHTLGNDESVEILKQVSGKLNPEYQKSVLMEPFCGKISEEENASNQMETCAGTKHNDGVASYSSLSANTNLDSVIKLVGMTKANYSCLPLVTHDTATQDRIQPDRVVSLHNEVLHLLEPLKMQRKNDLENNQKFQTRVSCTNAVNTPLMFSAGCELQEALGSVSRKEQDVSVWGEARMAEIEIIHQPDEVINSWITPECGSEHLLEAVVANACPGTSNVTSENSLCKSSKSLLTTEKKHGSCATGGQAVESAVLRDESSHHLMSSIVGPTEVYSTVRSPNELSSKTRSTCSEQSERLGEPAKMNRKRARPGESSRPRPRDRQLIQDRVKELREIVPNGSTCSIDALLERTIKHMLFLQSVTSHAEKLKKCAETKLHGKGIGLIGSCYDQRDASWALEVGSQSKIFPIVVENLDMNGQMLIEMLCEECSLFLEIAEAIRGLGLTILKGVTEARAEKTWACFIVEGQGNKDLQRMDVLWSLMQLLQPKTTI